MAKGKRPAIDEAGVTGKAESDELEGGVKRLAGFGY